MGSGIPLLMSLAMLSLKGPVSNSSWLLSEDLRAAPWVDKKEIGMGADRIVFTCTFRPQQGENWGLDSWNMNWLGNVRKGQVSWIVWQTEPDQRHWLNHSLNNQGRHLGHNQDHHLCLWGHYSLHSSSMLSASQHSIWPPYCQLKIMWPLNHFGWL